MSRMCLHLTDRRCWNSSRSPAPTLSRRRPRQAFAIADASTDGSVVRLPPGLLQPIAADDVTAVVAETALANPRDGIVEIAGPERAEFNEIVARYLKAVGDPRQ